MKSATNNLADFYREGWDSCDTGAKNPHYATSVASDVFQVARLARNLGFSREMAQDCRKSRGSTYFVGATKFRVDGITAKVVSSHPVFMEANP